MYRHARVYDTVELYDVAAGSEQRAFPSLQVVYVTYVWPIVIHP